jgi:recombination protein RecA
MAAKKPVKRGRPAGVDGPNEFNDTLKAVRSRFGDASIQTAGSMHQPDRISTGIFILDLALLGGIPHNRISMFIGEKHAGKSLLADKVIASAQSQYPDMIAVKIDVEGTHDSVWSAKLGVDTDKLYVFQPETGESAVDVADAMVRTKEVSVIVVDSIAALTPMKEIDSSAEDALVAMQARLVGNLIRKVNAGLIAERQRGHYVTVIFINQFRSKIGVVYGDPRSIPGGKALEFATSVQLIIKNKEVLGKDEFDVDTVAMNEHAFEIKKNKLNSGPRSAEFRVVRTTDTETGLGEGDVDDASTMLTYAKKFGAFVGGGSSWQLDFWDESHKFRGAADAISHLYADMELYWKLRNFLIHTQAAHLGMPEDFLERFLPD